MRAGLLVKIPALLSVPFYLAGGLKILYDMLTRSMSVVAFAMAASLPSLAADYAAPREGTWAVRDFRFHTGESLHELQLHYTTVGVPGPTSPRRDPRRRRRGPDRAPSAAARFTSWSCHRNGGHLSEYPDLIDEP